MIVDRGWKYNQQRWLHYIEFKAIMQRACAESCRDLSEIMWDYKTYCHRYEGDTAFIASFTSAEIHHGL